MTLSMSSTDSFSVAGAADAKCVDLRCLTENAFGRVELKAPQDLGGHPRWYEPNGAYRTGLKVHNTLTNTTGDELQESIPANGRKVLWYTCGPAVYNSSQMGHARAYLTFNILRRIMEDYFGYEVIYQINITDTDDKIILKARRNKLLADFEAEVAALAGGAGAQFKLVSERAEEALAAWRGRRRRRGRRRAG